MITRDQIFDYIEDNGFDAALKFFKAIDPRDYDGDYDSMLDEISIEYCCDLAFKENLLEELSDG